MSHTAVRAAALLACSVFSVMILSMVPESGGRVPCEIVAKGGLKNVVGNDEKAHGLAAKPRGVAKPEAAGGSRKGGGRPAQDPMPPPGNGSAMVPSISLAEVLELSKHARAGPRMMKMDIEGAEFEVLPDLLSKGLLCKGVVDTLSMEFHSRFIEMKLPAGEKCTACAALEKRLQYPQPTETCQPTTVLFYDDESYLHDGQNWPPVRKEVQAMFEPVIGRYRPTADMFRGCRAIFYDVGANIGTHVRKLFEPAKYPNAGYIQYFRKVLGADANRSMPFAVSGLCAFLFEGNPRHAPRLAKLEATYNAVGWRVRAFAPAAVSTKTGKTVEFFMNGDGGQEEWGAGVFNTTWRIALRVALRQKRRNASAHLGGR